MNKTIKKILVPPYNFYRKIEGTLFPKARSKQLYKKRIGRKCNLKNPSSLTEKLMYYKLYLYWKNDIVANLADKYKVRQFVTDCGLSTILNPLLGVWNKAKDIDWDSLPNSFVLKLNTGSGYNIVCRDKDTFDKKQATKQLNKWMRQHYGRLFAEQGIYSKIKKLIVAEKYIEAFNHGSPDDYKFFCSYGDVKFLFVASGRAENETKFDYYTPDWKWINVRNVFPNNGPVDKPKNYDVMLKYASILSKRFPLVRVDMYNIDGEIIFGEMTFTHFGCIAPFTPDSFDFDFGNMLPSVKQANKIN